MKKVKALIKDNFPLPLAGLESGQVVDITIIKVKNGLINFKIKTEFNTVTVTLPEESFKSHILVLDSKSSKILYNSDSE